MEKLRRDYLNNKKLGVHFYTAGRNLVNVVILCKSKNSITDKQLSYLEHLEKKNIAIDRCHGNIERYLSMKAAYYIIQEALADEKCMFTITPHSDILQ